MHAKYIADEDSPCICEKLWLITIITCNWVVAMDIYGVNSDFSYDFY